ncbi:PBSP domain protein [Penicillium riverlandense]|uniref:PBSP domain protein n=1 Tax=Penicillium riverlandense TaxID=1903569 RepID=UPI002546CC99|nr:PBSP domain protein [Penicillium riverlandense]KAJ5832107.1 PBSP domain protein [Penicillium riverlandense]
MTVSPAPTAQPNLPPPMNTANKPVAKQNPSIPKPRLRLHAQALRHPGTKAFLTNVPDISEPFDTALSVIVEHLYTSHNQQGGPSFNPCIPPTRSVTFILRDFQGLAHTNGTELDDDHKEIHMSLGWLQNTGSRPSTRREILGVLTHELVHCYQHSSPRGSGKPGPPGGLIEGIADFIRLKAGFVPAHWKRPQSSKERAEKWDQGYEHTAFFLAWLEDVRFGKGAVGLVNDRLGTVGYAAINGVGFWKGIFGKTVHELWEEYGQWLDAGQGQGQGGQGGEKKNWIEKIVHR